MLIGSLVMQKCQLLAPVRSLHQASLPNYTTGRKKFQKFSSINVKCTTYCNVPLESGRECVQSMHPIGTVPANCRARGQLVSLPLRSCRCLVVTLSALSLSLRLLPCHGTSWGSVVRSARAPERSKSSASWKTEL